MPVAPLPTLCTPSPVSDRELAHRRRLHGLDEGALAQLPVLRKLLARRAAEVTAAAHAELDALPPGGLRGVRLGAGLVGAGPLDALVACAVDRQVADARCRLGATHAWEGVDAHSLAVVAEALAQAVEVVLDTAGAGREGRALFRRGLALDQGVRMDGYAFATAQLGARDLPTAALRPESFLRALDRELQRAYRRAESVALVRATIAPTPDLEGTLRTLVGGAERASRRTDLVGRTGGQELCVALPGAGADGALRFLHRWLPEGHRDVTIGVAVAAPGEAVSGADLLSSSRDGEPVLEPVGWAVEAGAFEAL